jgi:flavin reductase (DIM6/NTAB) family NADH-FMN oxidoreductase RutF
VKEIFVRELNLNPMTLIGGEWWLIAAGNEKNGYNVMTASWGHLGSIWERPEREPAHMGLPTAVVYLRPQRYTKQIIDREELFTLSIFDKEYKKALAYLGTHSGRDGDKIAKAGLTPVFVDGTICFAEAKMMFVCRKLYHAPLVESGFVDKILVKDNYPDNDFHEMYVGEIIRVLSKE